MRFVKFASPYGDDIPRVGFEPLVVAQVALPAACAHSFFNGAPPPAPQLMPQLSSELVPLLRMCDMHRRCCWRVGGEHWDVVLVFIFIAAKLENNYICKKLC